MRKISNSIYKYFVALSILVLVVAVQLNVACAPRQPQVEPTVGRGTPPEDSFDPFAYPGDTALVTENKDSFAAQDEIDSSLFVIAAESESTFPDKVYHVLVYAGQDYRDAREEKRIAQDVFSDSIIIDYEVPYYRVVVGNFALRDDAERLLRRARALGYHGSWLLEEAVDSLFWITLESDSLIDDSTATDSLQTQPEKTPR